MREYSAEKPLPEVPPLVIPRFGGAASDEYESILIDRVKQKAADFLSKPTTPKPAGR
jgi:hypothetical protein